MLMIPCWGYLGLKGDPSMNKISLKYFNSTCLSALVFGLLINIAVAQHETISPPAMGEDTKGTPAQIEDQGGNSQAVKVEKAEEVEASTEKNKKKGGIFSALGTTKITESKRESGQVYRIQLEHSTGSKQYIEEHDSDGKIQSTSNDIEETPNLAKWKIGSW